MRSAGLRYLVITPNPNPNPNPNPIQVNILGLEIRRPLVELANGDVERLGRGNVAFITGNANCHLETLCEGAGAPSVATVH